jgi:1,4-dihydroxy-2-naphthoate octaprenyltransferase
MKDRLLSITSPLLLLIVWEALVNFKILNPLFFPPPSVVAVTGWQLLASGELLRHISVTVARVLVGFLVGGVPAILLGMLMGIWRPARLALEPLASAIYPIPKIALVPLFIVVFGIGETSKIAIIAVSVFFLVLLSTVAGVGAVDARYFEVGKNLGAQRWHLYWTVAFPGALPAIMTSIKLGMGFALTVIVGTEFINPKEGVGAFIFLTYQAFQIDEMFVGLIVTALLGWLSSLILDELERRIIPWRPAPRPLGAESAAQRQLKLWWHATRPFSFTASVTPVLLGLIIAADDGKLDFVLAMLTLVGAVTIHAGTNLVNDYYDHVKGADRPDSLGPSGVIQRGELTPQQVLIGGVGLFVVGSLVGLYLTYISGPFILILGLFSVAAGFFYTAGPAALAYIGLGELTVFLFMGPVMVVGSYYVQARDADLRIVLLSLPIAFLVAAILHANNLRDIEGDRVVGKRTLATLIGRAWGNREYFVLLAGGYVSLLVCVLVGYAPLWTLLAWLTAPIAWNNFQRAVAGGQSGDLRSLNWVIRRTATLHARFGQLMMVGFIVAMAVERLMR